MSNVHLKYTAESTQARKEMDKLHKENVRLKQGLLDVAKSSKQFSREAKAAYMAVMTPQEKYNRKVAELYQLYNKARISHGTLTRGIRKGREEMERAGRAGEKAHGPLSIRRLGAVAAGYFGITRAIGLAVRAMNEMDQKEREIAQRQRESRAGVGILQQLPGGPEKFAERAKKANELFLAVGGRSEAEAAREYFRIASAGQEEDAGLYAKLTQKAVIAEPGVIAKGVAALKKTTGGDVPTIIAQGIVAGAGSPATTSEIMQAAGRLGSTAREAGIKRPEMLAATAQAATEQGEAALGGTLIKRLLTEFSNYQLLTKEEMEKKGLDPKLVAQLSQGTLAARIGVLEKMGGLMLPEMKDIKGEQRARLGYLALARDLPGLRAYTAKVAAAGPATLQEKIGYTKAVPKMLGTEAQETADRARQVAETKVGTLASFAGSIEDDIATRMLEGGAGRFDRWVSGVGVGVTRKVMGAEMFAKRFAGQGSPETKALYQQSREAWWDQERQRNMKQPPPLIGVPGPIQPGSDGGTTEVSDPQANAQLQEQTRLLGQIARGFSGPVQVGSSPLTEPVE